MGKTPLFPYDFRGYPCFFSPLFHRVRISSKTRAVCDPPIACVTVGSDPILTQAIGVPESLSPWEEILARWSPRGILEGGVPCITYNRKDQKKGMGTRGPPSKIRRGAHRARISSQGLRDSQTPGPCVSMGPCPILTQGPGESPTALVFEEIRAR